jgi:transposase
LALSKEKIFHEKFIKGSVNSKIFIEFLDEMLAKFTEEEKKELIIIMDNARFHTTNEVVQFFREKKIKGLTICPYRSYLNMIELVFRFIKNYIYKNIYNKFIDLQNDIVKILRSPKLQKSLMNLYKETLGQILVFMQNNNQKNIDIILKKINEQKD